MGIINTSILNAFIALLASDILNIRMSRPVVYFYLFVIFSLPCKGELICKDQIYKKSVHTVLLHVTGFELSDPVIELNGDKFLSLQFDDLTTEIGDYYYTVILCDANWEPATISNFEYIEGFTENSIVHYKFSINTNFPYIQYSLELPNRDMSITKSGNYLLVIYEDNSPDSIVLTRRFYVVEPLVHVEARVKKPGIVKYTHSHQEIQLEIVHEELVINNAFEEIKVTILQNLRWDQAYHVQSPVFVKDKRLIYTMDGKIIFPGNKEFRYFDIRNNRLINERVKHISLNNDSIWLVTENIRTFSRHTFLNDINGKYVIGNYETFNNNLDADYAHVHFILLTQAPFTYGDIYVFGELSQWQISNKFKMEYMAATKTYEKPIFLKQGYYNYMYAFVHKSDGSIDTAFLEGNSQETDNDYQILVYYRPTGGRYDRLAAFQKLNSLD